MAAIPHCRWTRSSRAVAALVDSPPSAVRMLCGVPSRGGGPARAAPAQSARGGDDHARASPFWAARSSTATAPRRRSSTTWPGRAVGVDVWSGKPRAVTEPRRRRLRSTLRPDTRRRPRGCPDRSPARPARPQRPGRSPTTARSGSRVPAPTWHGFAPYRIARPVTAALGEVALDQPTADREGIHVGDSATVLDQHGGRHVLAVVGPGRLRGEQGLRGPVGGRPHRGRPDRVRRAAQGAPTSSSPRIPASTRPTCAGGSPRARPRVPRLLRRRAADRDRQRERQVRRQLPQDPAGRPRSSRSRSPSWWSTTLSRSWSRNGSGSTRCCVRWAPAAARSPRPMLAEALLIGAVGFGRQRAARRGWGLSPADRAAR